MPVFAPGAWAGVNDAFLIARQKQQEDMRLAEGRQRMARDAYTMDMDRQDRQSRSVDDRNVGHLYRGYGTPPPVQTPPPTQTPAPGQGSMPMQAPGQGSMPMLAPGQGATPQPPMQAPGQGATPQQSQPDPRVLAVMRVKGDLQALDREMAHPGLNPEQKSILAAEKTKAQDRLAQLTGQPPPYRMIPTSGTEPAGAPPPQPGAMTPPPVSAPRQPSLFERMVASSGNMSDEELGRAIDRMGPTLRAQAMDEAAQARERQMDKREERLNAALIANVDHKKVMEGQGERRLDQSDQRIKLARERATAGAVPTASELSDPQTARIFYDVWKTNGHTPPFPWGKAGEADRAAWMKAVKQFSQDDKQSGGDLAGSQAGGKASASALTANTKDLAAIRPFKVMLDKNANVAIELSKKVGLSNSALANRPIQWLKKNAGSDPNLREYLSQIKIVQTEAARVLNNPRLVGALTDDAQHEMQSIISGTMPLKDTERVLQRLMQDGTNRVKAMEDENALLKRSASGKPDEAGGSDQDAEAIAWAKANPKDPRAVKIMKLHGM